MMEQKFLEIKEILIEKKLVVVCGSGGVGKTSLSAALAYFSSQLGQRSLVVTIDPAKRLMDALGISEAGEQISFVPGTNQKMAALMVDSKVILDEFVCNYLESEEDAKALLDNRLYRFITNEWPGVHEYAAVQKVGELTKDWDVIILDTPPTKNAAEFFSAPNRLLNFMDKGVAKFFFSGEKSFASKIISTGSNLALKVLSNALGSGAFGDIFEFFRCMSPLIAEVQNASRKMKALLHGNESSFFYVTTPTFTHLNESRVFYEYCKKNHFQIDSLLANRLWNFKEIYSGLNEGFFEGLENSEFLPPSKSEELCEETKLKLSFKQIQGILKSEKEVLSKLKDLAQESHFFEIPQKPEMNIKEVFN